MINDFFNILLPQSCLALFIIIQLLLSMFMSSSKFAISRLISLIGISLSILLLTTVQIEPQYFGLQNSIMSDCYTQMFHFIILLCGFFTVLLTKNLSNELKNHSFGLQTLILTAIFGAMNIVSANDFITLFISIELLSFPLYFLIATAKGYPSKEASFKYLITTAVSTAVFLFGVSYLYGVTGSINLSEIYEITIEQPTSLIYVFASIFIILGLFAKLGIFPFANWIIDVYKGCETSILAFISTIPKLALFGIICRLLVFPLGSSFELTFIIAILAIVTAFWANTFGIRERNVKAIFACSSSANASYVMLAACLVSAYNLSTVLFYLICYVLMDIAVFAFLNIAEGNKIKMNVEDYKNMFYKNPVLIIAYAVAVIGLAGFPITSGFVSKIYLFSAIARSGLIFIPFLLIILVLTVVALYYYLKVLRPIFISDIEQPAIKLEANFSQRFVLVVTTIATVLIGIYPEKIIELCRYIAFNI